MKKIFTLIVMLAATLGMQAQDTWTIVGQTALTGANWDPAFAENDMTAAGDVFTLQKQGLMLKGGNSYEYKVAKNHAWDESYPAEGNATLAIEEDGAYTVDFTFNPATTELTAVPTKTGEYVAPEPGSQTWTVAGVTELCGSSWDPADANNDMTTTDGVNYTWSKEGVLLDKATPYEFKIVADHAWDEAYGGPAGNYQLFVDEPGEYTVVIAFNAESHEIGVTTTKTADHEFGEKTWTICGVETLCGSSWDPADTNNDMVKVEEGLYQLVRYNVELLADTEYEFKVAANHAWSESYGMNGGSSNQIMSVDADGVYDVTFIFMLETKDLAADAVIAAGIKNVNLNGGNNGIVYNLQGQRVQDGFRGIAIKNGRKTIMK